jgi:alginate biosynthesis protein AlgK
LLAVKPNSTEAEQREAEGLLKKAFANGEAGTLIPLAMLYLQYPHTFPNVNAQQKINEWRASGYPEAGLAQVLLYRTQGTYDQHLGEVESICKQALRTNDVCYMELATVYQKRGEADKQAALLEQMQSGYAMGSVPAMRVDTVARVLADSTLGKPDEKTAQQLLEKVAPGYPASWVSLAQLLYDYPELGDVNKMMEYLDNGRAADQPRAELLLGKLYYEGKLVLPDAKKAEEHLLKAAPTQISAHYYLGQLYRRGYLGHPDAQKAVNELLTSARGGQNSADFALAQLFSQGKGIKPDPVNAWVFGQLAQAQNTPQATDLAQQLNDQLPPEKRAQAQSLLQREQQVRGTTAQNALAMQALQEEKDGEDAPL